MVGHAPASFARQKSALSALAWDESSARLDARLSMADENSPKSFGPKPLSQPTVKVQDSASSSEPVSAATEKRELTELRKEVVEARNLIIKTDNLLKNMHGELKRMGDRQEEFARRRFFSSAAAYALFAVIAMVGAFSAAHTMQAVKQEEADAAGARAAALTKQAQADTAQWEARRAASAKAAKIYEQLSAEKEGPGLSQAMANALSVDKTQLSALEAKALEDRVSSMRVAVTQGALDRGEQAIRRNDNKAISSELGHYLELSGPSNDPQLYYHLGFARFQLKDFAAATDPLARFLALQPQGKLAQAVGYWLGMSYEETNAPAKAAETYQRALALFPGSQLAPTIRNQIRKAQAAAAAAPAPAATPAKK